MSLSVLNILSLPVERYLLDLTVDTALSSLFTDLILSPTQSRQGI
jgi:hypothetical protein